MRSAAKPRSLTTVTGLALLTVITLTVWLGPAASDNPVEANHQTVAIGIDTNTSGNTALALSGGFQACRALGVGEIIDVDLYVTGLNDLLSWEAYIKYDQSKIVISAPGAGNQNPGEQYRFLLQQAQPSPPGNNLTNTSEPLPDSLNPGIYRVGAYDGNVLPGVEDPDPIFHTHKDGVLVRLKVQGAGAGFSAFQISPFESSPGLVVGPFLRNSSGVLIADGNGDSFIDNVSNASFIVGGGTCTDQDGDLVPDSSDNCPTVANGVAQENIPGVGNQTNSDGDVPPVGDACDTDDDNDGRLDTSDTATCPGGHSAQIDFDCDDDNVSDGNLDPDDLGPVVAGPDNCYTVANTNQTNTDVTQAPPGDALGDACDPDDDNDTFLDGPDNCDLVYNNPQTDTDGDGIGNACDTEDDGDGYSDTSESWVGTLLLDNCGNQSGSVSMAWPADLSSSGGSLNKITLTDLSSFIAPLPKKLNTSPNDPGYNQRWDLVPGAPAGKKINLVDISSITTSYPPMLGGAKAFGGPACAP